LLKGELRASRTHRRQGLSRIALAQFSFVLFLTVSEEMRFAVCLLVLLATLLDGVEGRARFRLTFFKAGLPSSPDCAPLAEAELVYADGEWRSEGVASAFSSLLSN
jgi:hypothetical protein